jgi:plastocyanin
MKMTGRVFLPLALLLMLGTGLNAETLDGMVVVKKKLTKLRVTTSIPMYERGPIVGLDVEQDADPIAFERSRVVVYLEGGATSGSSAALPKMLQLNRQFLPEILVVEAGSKVSFPNADPIFHNVFSLSKAKSFDLGNYPKGDTRVITFSKPGIVSVNCHLHPNMSGTIVVTPNKWNSRVARDGRFEFQEVPPGTYTVVAWHKSAGFFRQQIQIEPGRNAHVEFFLPVAEDGQRLEPHHLTGGDR